MKRFLCDIVLFALVQALFWGLFLAVGYRIPTYHISSTRLKHERLRKAGSPRIIFVGGSNLAFGLHSRMVSDQLPGYRPVNMGVIAALHAQFMLNEIRNSLRAGDIVVLALEYEVLRGPGKLDGPTPITLMQTLEQRPQSVAFLDWVHVKALLDSGVTEWAGSVVRSTWSNLGQGRKHDLDLDLNRTFNKFGDLVSHRGFEGKGSENPPRIGRLGVKAAHSTILVLNEFHDDCRRRGVEVVISYPPIPRRRYNENIVRIQKVAQRLAIGGLTIPIINSVEEMIFEDGQFYDTVNHLTYEAGAERTQRLIDGIKRYQAEKRD